jgi:hypothetical protein
LRSTQDTVKQSANKIVVGYPLLEKEELVKNSLEWDAFEREFVDYGDVNEEQDYEDESDFDNKRRSEDSFGSIYLSSDIMPELEPVPVEGLEGLMLETSNEKVVRLEEEVHQRQLEQQMQESEQLLADMKKNHEKIAEREKSRMEQEMKAIIQPVAKERSKLSSFQLSNNRPSSSERRSFSKDLVIEKRGGEGKQIGKLQDAQEHKINNVVMEKQKHVSIKDNSSLLQKRSSTAGGTHASYKVTDTPKYTIIVYR